MTRGPMRRSLLTALVGALLVGCGATEPPAAAHEVAPLPIEAAAAPPPAPIEPAAPEPEAAHPMNLALETSELALMPAITELVLLPAITSSRHLQMSGMFGSGAQASSAWVHRGPSAARAPGVFAA